MEKGWKLFLCDQGQRRAPTVTTPASHGQRAVRPGREREASRSEREKDVVSADDVMLYVEHPQDATKKVLGLMNEFSKVARYEISNRLHFYTPTMNYL